MLLVYSLTVDYLENIVKLEDQYLYFVRVHLEEIARGKNTSFYLKLIKGFSTYSSCHVVFVFMFVHSLESHV